MEHPPAATDAAADLGFEASLTELQRLASIGVVAGAVVHEINNALTPVLTYSQLALANPHDAALAKKALEVAVRGVSHASQVATSVLSLVRAAQSAAPAPSSCNVADVIKLATSDALSGDKAAEIHLEIACDPTLHAAISPGELQQVLSNLLRNSTRACQGRGTVLIACSTWNTPEGTPSLRISVTDSGSGVAESIRPRLFLPLASDPSLGGHGFGLMVSRRLLRAAGGDLTFDARHSPGSKFDITVKQAQIA